ncbi:MAG: SDR family oxidoreductase [Nitrospirae bacterium]|nr:SDR family oxidoreductase [Nitrospirota bacterium]
MSDRRHIVIAGASSGIGAALARSLAADGHVLYLCARRVNRLEEVVRGLPGTTAFVCDVSREPQVKTLAEEIRKHTAWVDALINCAGGFGAIGPAISVESEEWTRTFEVNLFGTFFMIKHTVPLMVRERSPRIINFSGGGAFHPFPNYSAYAASKAAVIRLTENVAAELAPRGIAVNAVAPGFVATEIHERTLRAGRERAGPQYDETEKKLREGSVPMQVPVECVRYLLSEQARGLTGKTISARHDPWASPEFSTLIPEINKSEIYSMRRLDLSSLPDENVRRRLNLLNGRS